MIRKIVTDKEFEVMKKIGRESEFRPLSEAMAGIRPKGSWRELFEEIDYENTFPDGITTPEGAKKIRQICIQLWNISADIDGWAMKHPVRAQEAFELSAIFVSAMELLEETLPRA